MTRPAAAGGSGTHTAAYFLRTGRFVDVLENDRTLRSATIAGSETIGDDLHPTATLEIGDRFRHIENGAVDMDNRSELAACRRGESS